MLIWSLERSIFSVTWLNHSQSLAPYEGTLEEYNELAIQFGYVVLFSSALTPAPLLALVNNYLEIHLDGKEVLLNFELSKKKNKLIVFQHPNFWVKDAVPITVVSLTPFLPLERLIDWFLVQYTSSLCYFRYSSILLSYCLYQEHNRSDCGIQFSRFFQSWLLWRIGRTIQFNLHFFLRLIDHSIHSFMIAFGTSAVSSLSRDPLILLGIAVGLEHLMLILKYLIHAFIPDMPKLVRKKLAKQELLSFYADKTLVRGRRKKARMVWLKLVWRCHNEKQQ